jgi:small subunit ribosomal protein S9
MADEVKFKGKYIGSIGRRKTSQAQVRLYKSGEGLIAINGLKANQYFKEEELLAIINQPLKLVGLAKDFNLSANVNGGGKKCQAEAVRHGIARALLEVNPELRPSLKTKGWITRDARKKERKKPGLKKARRAPQWAKR